MDTATVKKIFDYKDGFLYWRESNGRRARAGAVAGHLRTLGYWAICVRGRSYPAHRLVWLWHGNKLPKELDHINGDKADNRIENLRAATRGQNMRNTPVRKDNALGVRGVDFIHGKYRARLAVDGRTVAVGRFRTLPEAIAAMTQARKQHHGSFIRATREN